MAAQVSAAFAAKSQGTAVDALSVGCASFLLRQVCILAEGKHVSLQSTGGLLEAVPGDVAQVQRAQVVLEQVISLAATSATCLIDSIPDSQHPTKIKKTYIPHL